MKTVTDNFLNNQELNFVKQALLGPEMFWSYSDIKVSSKGETDLRATQFYHLFVDTLRTSSLIGMIEPIIDKLDAIAISRIKANLEPYKGEERYYSNFHYDYIDSIGEPSKNIRTGIFYLNTNNGYTEFEDGEIVKSVENRYVEFSGDTLHRGVSSTDVKKRIIINFNYFKKS